MSEGEGPDYRVYVRISAHAVKAFDKYIKGVVE
jgi:hypothetical protein